MPRTRSGLRGGVITGWGAALGDKTITNHDLEKTLDTSHEWIVERSGISERHIGGSTMELSVRSGEKALAMAGLAPSDIDALVLATTTPDRCVPATSPSVQRELGLSCGAFDINAACSGWVYALVTAHGLIAMGAEKVLLIGTDTLSRIVDWEDRNTAVLFADGSGAAVLEGVDGPGQLLAWDLDADGTAEELLYAEIGGSIKMAGREVFRRAVRIMVDSATKSLDLAGVTADEIRFVIPHQANLRIIQAACDRLGIPSERAAIVLGHTGNTSAASIPLALAHQLDQGNVTHGDLILFVGFGAGMTAASAVIKWGGETE
jgi:3-oxoacyl-[acyl-carrier-protein] synthase-3